MITTSTKLIVVIGHPINHSFSPFLHNAIYEKEGVDAVMLAFDVEKIESFVAAMRTLPIHLAAVTLPHKETVMAHVDAVDADAKEIGAVNTIVRRDDGSLTGFNTDIVGIAAALKDVALKGKNVLILGAGGAARPVAYHAREHGANIYCHNRTFDTAQVLCRDFGGTAIEKKENLHDLSFNVVVNATPLGLQPNDPLPFPEKLIRADSVVFDLVYTPLRTPLLKAAEVRGAHTISGLTMFIAQGLEQERLWLGREVSDAGYTALVQDALEKRAHY